LKAHTRPDSEFRAGACHSYYDAWVRLTQATGCFGQFSEELSWLRHGVTFAMTHPNAPLKRAEPQHDHKMAGCQASMPAAGYSEAEFTQFCSRDRPLEVVLYNHLHDPRHLAFARQKVQEGLQRSFLLMFQLDGVRSGRQWHGSSSR
jgi:hypothetical protein